MNTVSELHHFFCRQMESCLLELLQVKLLYQNCSFNPQTLEKGKSDQDVIWYRKAAAQFEKTMVPIFAPNNNVEPEQARRLEPFTPPIIHAPGTVSTSCENCKGETPPHNLVQISLANKMERAALDQTYVLSYQCQKCKKGMLVFLVRKRGFKLQLVGRNQVPEITIPTFFPKRQRKRFSEAEKAYQTGSQLAAICLLRIALEEYLRDATGSMDACSGNELWKRYKNILSPSFPLSCETGLGDTYEGLSKIIHAPDQLSENTYPLFKAQLNRFFKLLELYPPSSQSTTTKCQNNAPQATMI